MMKKPLIVSLGFFLLIIGILAWWFSDAQVIKRQTKELAESLTIEITDGKSTRLGKTQDFSSLLTNSATCSVNIENYKSDFRRDDLVSAHHMLAHNCDSSSASASNIEITEISDTQAIITANLYLTVLEKGGTKHAESCKSVLIWKKNDSGKWKLESIDIDRQ